MIAQGCPNCGRPMRDQPNPIIGDEEMIWKEMPAAAAEGGYDNDMSGNPLKEGILADGGWQNRKVRDETVGAVQRETFSMEPYEPWWHQSAEHTAEERQIDGDAEIESVMPPTGSDSPTIEAKMNEGPGWHGIPEGLAYLSLTELPPPVVIDGEPFSPEMGQELRAKYDGGPKNNPNFEPHVFMISHPDDLYLMALKETIETGKRGQSCKRLQDRMEKEKMEQHAESHSVYPSQINLPDSDRNLFHDDHLNLSRALYATQAYTHDKPYLVGRGDDPRAVTTGYRATNENWMSGSSILPVMTSHPELGEILQRVADMDSLEPLLDWLDQNPELTEYQQQALAWMARQEIIEKQGSPLMPNPEVAQQAVEHSFANSLNPSTLKPPPQLQDRLRPYIPKEPIREGPAPNLWQNVRPMAPQVPKTPPPIEPTAPGGAGMGRALGPLGWGLTGLDVANQVGNQQGWWDSTKGDPVPKDWGKAWNFSDPKEMVENSTTKWLLDNAVDPALNAVNDVVQKSPTAPLGTPGTIPVPGLPVNVNPGAIKDLPDTVKDVAGGAADKVKGLFGGDDEPKQVPKPEQPADKSNLIPNLPGAVPPPQKPDTRPPSQVPKVKPPAPPKRNPGPPKTPDKPTQPKEEGGKTPIPVPIPPVIPKQAPTPTPAPGAGGGAKQPPPKKPPKTEEKPRRPRKNPLRHLPNLIDGPDIKWSPKAPMEYMTHVQSLEEIRNRMVKRAEREDAKEHPSSHSEIPANDINNPDEIDPHQKKDGDMSDWQKDFSVNDIGGSRQDPGAVVVTVQSDRPEDFDIKDIADVLGVDENSEPVKLVTDFWDHFMDHVDKPEKERNSKDPLLSLLDELIGNERGHEK